MIKVSNTLSGKQEEFKPQNDKEVSMYVCGVTPYDSVHLGHARAYVVFDVIKRHLLNRGYNVRHIQNFTDVDDKIIKRAGEKGVNPSDIANTYIEDYFNQTEKLNILKASEYPRVTEMIPKIISFIKTLIDKSFAYIKDGDVYFSVEKFKDYGKLSKRNLHEQLAGARVETSDKKLSDYDFALWKKAKDGEPESVTWNSPWSKGRPGWHIECSVMSSDLLGSTIDIHGGGQDLIFPHHENEIAQSEAATGKKFVNYWIHNGFVTVNKEKMSKSLGNFFTLKDIFEKYDPRVVRYYLLTQHYKSPLDFSDEGLNTAKNSLQGLDDAYLRLVAVINDKNGNPSPQPSPARGEGIIRVDASASGARDEGDLTVLKEKFMQALDYDFNSEKALAILHELKNIILNELFSASAKRLVQLKDFYEDLSEKSLGIILPAAQNYNSELENLLKERNAARTAKNWAEADRVRKLIDEKGYKIVDNKDGTSVLTKKI